MGHFITFTSSLNPTMYLIKDGLVNDVYLSTYNTKTPKATVVL